MIKRTYTISISKDPAISGYGGYDEYTIGPLTNEQADILMYKLDKLIETLVDRFKVEGGWTGVQ